VLKTPDSLFKGSYQMLNIKQLNKASDSSIKLNKEQTRNRMFNEITGYFLYGKEFNKGWKEINLTLKKDTKNYSGLIPDSTRNIVTSKAADKINLLKNSLDVITNEYLQKKQELRMYQIEWNKKFALAFACMVLFIIGAPLGSIIRKGGLGMPLVIAVVFFLIWHLMNMFGEKFVRQDLMTPFAGIWMASYILLPIGIFLVYKAMNDSQLFNNEFYFRTFKSIRNKIKLIIKPRNNFSN
jgi:lipopolysaccharide export system permease protein